MLRWLQRVIQHRTSIAYCTRRTVITRSRDKIRGRHWKPAAFTVLVGSTSYITSVLYHEKLRRHEATSVQRFGPKNSFWDKIKQYWFFLSFNNKFLYTVITINGLVFLSWRVPRLSSIMSSYFASSLSSKSSSLLLCNFSHVEVFHIGINMLALWTFLPPFLSIAGREHSWPFYLTAGTFAVSTGYYIKLLRNLPTVASLGASGALMAVAAVVVFNHPDASLYIVFLPFVPIPAYVGLAGVVTLDIIGLLRGWQMFDHGAHLGGIAFGICYYKWLQDLLVHTRHSLIEKLKMFI